MQWLMSVSVVAVLALVAVASVQAKCKCKVPVVHYKEMGCEPVFSQPEDCCPSHYICPVFKDMCYVKGNVYIKGEGIDTNLTQHNCFSDCFCSKDESEDITCAHINCPETLDPIPLGPECYKAYDLESCCSTKTVCPPFNDLAKCEVKGETYFEGQRWYPEGKNLECVCKPEFEGKLKAPFCVELSCGVEFTSTLNIKNRCAPVFSESKGACPIKWKCQKGRDVVVPNQNEITSEQKCSYGNKTLNVGDKLLIKQSSTSPKIDCKCKIPPLITCIQSEAVNHVLKSALLQKSRQKFKRRRIKNIL